MSKSAKLIDAMLTEDWDGEPGWYVMQVDHVASMRYNPKNPGHAKLAKGPNALSRLGAYIGYLDDMGIITHHLVKGKPKSGKPWARG